MCFVGLVTFLSGQEDPYYDMSIKIDSLIQIGLDSHAYPGAQVLVRYRDSIIYHNAWGHHTYDDIREVQIDDIYDLASITKVSTGLPILMQLYGEGKLNLDAPLTELISGFNNSDKRYITLRAALAHQSGLIPYIVYWLDTVKENGQLRKRFYRNSYSKRFPIKITDRMYLRKNFYKKMKKAINKSEVRTVKQYEYSGLIFLLLPELIEDIVQEDLKNYLYRKIYGPIGAHELFYHPLEQVQKDRIVPTEYDSSWRKQLVHGTVHDEAAAMLRGISCNAGLFGSAESLSILFQLYLNRGKWDGDQIISGEAVDAFTRQAYPHNRRGLGFDRPLEKFDADLSSVAESASAKSFGHTGFTGTLAWADPTHDLIYIFLSNRVYPSRHHRQLYDLSIRPKIQQVVYDYLMKIRAE